MQPLIGRDDFENLLRSLADALFQQAESHLQDQTWRAIALDVRFDHQGGFNYKIRAATASASPPITMPASMTLLVLSLDALRRQLPQDQWHGFLLTVTADQQCEMTFNYDPNCADDPTFYAD
ncbi:MAG: hypothetical protein AB7K24_02900 [Gemmataceae bacterium]